MRIPLPSARLHAPGTRTPACPCDCGARLECVRVPGLDAYWLCDACGWCEGDDEPRAFAAAWPAPEHGLYRLAEGSR